VTVDELGRRIERLEGDFKTGLAGLHRRLDELNYVHPETLDTKLLLEAALRGEIERRVSDLETGRKDDERERASNRRLAISAIVTGLLLPILLVILLSAMGYR
jgi:hypothetical protein